MVAATSRRLLFFQKGSGLALFDFEYLEAPMAGPKVLPRVLDHHGRVRDPRTGNPMEDGNEGDGSIFAAPHAETAPDYRVFTGNDVSQPFSEVMETLRRAGFEGDSVTLMLTPRPQDVDRVPSPPPPAAHHSDFNVETSLGSFYHTECAYCWAVVQGKERERGFTLREICQAAAQGCSTCNVLQDGIVEFARLIFPRFSAEKVRVRQKENGESKLLSETRAVNVCFDEYGGETIVLTFGGSGEFAEARGFLGYSK
jgi:hypothetical protein